MKALIDGEVVELSQEDIDKLNNLAPIKPEITVEDRLKAVENAFVDLLLAQEV